VLSEFIEDFREEILASANKKTVSLAAGRESSVDLRRGMPLFFQHLVEYLKGPELSSSQTNVAAGAAVHGRELLRLNYTLSHVVHCYGAMCQAITEIAHQRKANISSKEFNDLNSCLDVAIASAVSEYQFRSDQASHARESLNLGSLVHELRNALSSATVAHEMIKQGLVGVGGSTSKVLEENLDRMRRLIDRALSEVRLRTDPEIQVEKFVFNTLVDQILLTARSDAKKKDQTLIAKMPAGIELHTDRQLLLTSIANLVQNAIKYSKDGSTISTSAKVVKDNLIFKITDECGGIKPSILKNIFKPFRSGGDKSGLGLGLSIVQRSVSMIQGKLLLENSPGVGCTFVLQIPITIPVVRKTMVSGKDSVHPRRKK
jgi:signal transduction histidine kinase